MTTKSFNSLIDVSFIQINANESLSIDMNSNNIYNIRKIDFNKGSNTYSDFLLYDNYKIITEYSGDVNLYVNDLHTTNLTINNLFTDNIICRDTFKVLSLLDCSNINTNNIACNGNFIVSDLLFTQLSTITLDCSNINLDLLDSEFTSIKNTIDLSVNVNIFNSSIVLKNDLNKTLDIFKNNNIPKISYSFGSSTSRTLELDSEFVVLYGKLKVNNLINIISFSDTGVDSTSYFGLTEVTNLILSSDDRLKHNESNINNAIDTINKLKPKTYTKLPYNNSNLLNLPTVNNDSFYSSGYIAQDISNDIPEFKHIVQTIENSNYLSVNYTAIQPYITKAIQELSNYSNILDSSINSLESDLLLIENNSSN